MLPGRVVSDRRLLDAQLERDEAEQLVADFQGVLRGEATKEADEADLIGEPQAIRVAATLGDFGEIGFAQGCFTDHLAP